MTSKQHDSEALETYKLLAEIPSISSATFLKNSSDRPDIKTISLNLSARDHVSEQKLSLNKILTIQGDGKSNSDPKLLSTTPSTITPNPNLTVVATFFSPSSTKKAILRERERAWPDKKAGKARIVEIWRGSRCELRLEVNDFHGAFTSDETFGSFSFNQTEDSILYSAEAHPPKAEEGSGSTQQSFDFVPPLGEKFGSRLRPAVFLLRFGNSSHPSLFQIKPPKDSLYLGQATFAPDGNSAFLTGYDAIKDGRRLGIIYCTNRPASIYSVVLPSPDQKAEKDKMFEAWNVRDQDFIRLSSEKVSARSPRVHSKSNGGFLVWVGNEEGGAHNDCAAIYGIDLSSPEPLGKEAAQTLLPILDKPSKGGFAGAYLEQLPKEAFFLNEKSEVELMFNTICGSRRIPVLLNLSNKKYRPLAPILDSFSAKPDYQEMWSYNALSISSDGSILATRSAPQIPPQLVVTDARDSSESNLRWKLLWRSEEDWETEKEGDEVLLKLSKIKSSIISEIPGAASLVQAIVIESNSSSKKALLFPHGGPHGSSTYDFSPTVAALALNGYNFVIPNYSGSLGLGQTFAHSLLGKAGSLDIEDCLASAQHLVKLGIADAKKICVTGGSHGGFIGSHLVGQYPDVFKAAVLRNPVVANGEMSATSDIRDWCFSEFSEPFDFSNPPITTSAEFHSRTQAMSPISHVEKIKAPVLILLGLSDQRVPPQQGRLLFHALEGQGKKVRMLAFESADHALETVQAEWNGFEASFKWFEDALN